MIPRLVQKTILTDLESFRKVMLVLGARQVGKTTLLKSIQAEVENKGIRSRFINCEIEEDRTALNTTSLAALDRLVKNINLLFIDEVQRLDAPGLVLKVLFDQYADLKIIATGSSSFEMKNKLSEPLTGRLLGYTLFPLSLEEILAITPRASDPVYHQSVANHITRDMLLYGSYPEVHLLPDRENKKRLLDTLVESYLFRDVLAFQKVRFSQAVVDLARALAYQAGSQVNENELSRRLKIDRKTVVSYIEILEKSFVIRRLFPYSKNPRREIGTQNKIYFLDNGIRNALTGDFKDLALRTDRGALWENFLIMERRKTLAQSGKMVRSFFWRTYNGAEVDYLEEAGGELEAWEFKYGKSQLSRGARSFTEVYGVDVQLVNQDNYLEFISGRAAL